MKKSLFLGILLFLDCVSFIYLPAVITIRKSILMIHSTVLKATGLAFMDIIHTTWNIPIRQYPQQRTILILKRLLSLMSLASMCGTAYGQEI